MKPINIIKLDSQRMKYDGEAMIRKINILLNDKRGDMLQHGNSLLLLIKLPDNNAELHLFTADNAKDLTVALKDFIVKIKKSNLNYVYGSGSIPKILKLLNAYGIKTEKSDKPEYKWMAKV
jgi:hypothetical protein